MMSENSQKSFKWGTFLFRTFITLMSVMIPIILKYAVSTYQLLYSFDTRISKLETWQIDAQRQVTQNREEVKDYIQINRVDHTYFRSELDHIKNDLMKIPE